LKNKINKLKAIGLTANIDKLKCKALVDNVARLVVDSGYLLISDEATAGLIASVPVTRCGSLIDVAKASDLFLIIGGDGTMLRVARETAGSKTPLLGINAGGLGFLTAVPHDALSMAWQKILAGEFSVEVRPFILATGSSFNQDFSMLALNDFVVTRGITSRMIELEVHVDDQFLTSYRCDGLIVCTPTGSTAYSLSAGGPIISPQASVLGITPICPHTLNNRCVLVGIDSIVSIRAISERVEVFLTADGQVQAPVQPQSIVKIHKSQLTAGLVRLNDDSFFNTLRQKLHWRGSHV